MEDLTRRLGGCSTIPSGSRPTALARSSAPWQYSWEAVTDQYERLLTSVYEAQRPGSLPVSVLEPESPRRRLTPRRGLSAGCLIAASA